MTVTTTARARARAEITEEIKRVARRHLAEHGTDLSLRAVARDLGMASSAVYRYFPSRDDLLTALIVDTYDAVGETAEQAVEAAAAGVAAQWLAMASAIRGWALAQPHDYALVYGSPVPGYQAPQATIAPASRVGYLALRIVADGVRTGEITGVAGGPIPVEVREDFVGIERETGLEVPDAVLSRALVAWTSLFGTISFELFGHLHNVIHDFDAFFGSQMQRAAQFVISGDGDSR
ncbi:MAG TPA: TetR/AcrR family transcriptional regulator [Acidimicrobiales bacterium]|nr:TetR/AcrR family transcriptional regulator [Acidimicrobiales bacterium]